MPRWWTVALCLGAIATCVATANPLTKLASIRVPIPTGCKLGFFGPHFPVTRSGTFYKDLASTPDYVDWDPGKAKPVAFKDPRTQVTLYVESDGRHLAAIDEGGQLLWIRDPFQDAGLCPYRTPRPVIYKLELAQFEEYQLGYVKALGFDMSHVAVSLYFDSSQFGLIDEKTGDFYYMGQN